MSDAYTVKAAGHVNKHISHVAYDSCTPNMSKSAATTLFAMLIDSQPQPAHYDAFSKPTNSPRRSSRNTKPISSPSHWVIDIMPDIMMPNGMHATQCTTTKGN
jgi:hypothetical protein